MGKFWKDYVIACLTDYKCKEELCEATWDNVRQVETRWDKPVELQVYLDRLVVNVGQWVSMRDIKVWGNLMGSQKNLDD